MLLINLIEAEKRNIGNGRSGYGILIGFTDSPVHRLIVSTEKWKP